MKNKSTRYIVAILITTFNIAFISTLIDRVNTEYSIKQSVGTSLIEYSVYLFYYSLPFALTIMLLVVPISLSIDYILKKINVNKISISLFLHVIVFSSVSIFLSMITTGDDVFSIHENDWYFYGLFVSLYTPLVYRGLLHLFQESAKNNN
jgi:hypothetical protein